MLMFLHHLYIFIKLVQSWVRVAERCFQSLYKIRLKYVEVLQCYRIPPHCQYYRLYIMVSYISEHLTTYCFKIYLNSMLLLFSHSVTSDSVIPLTATCQASLSITISGSSLKVLSIELVMPSDHFVLWRPLLLLLSIFPTVRSFLMTQFISSAGQSIGALTSALVFPMNIQDWFPLGLTDLISVQSKGLPRVFSNTTFQKHQFFSAQPSLLSNSPIYWGFPGDWDGKASACNAGDLA